MNRKQFVIASLFTVALITLVFTPISNQQNQSYDPWMDYNGDGKIDANDLSQMGQTYGSSGGSTRKVYVTNLPLDSQGNLMVSSPKNSAIITVFNNITVSFVRTHSVYLSQLIEVGEFNEIYVYVSFRDWTTRWSPFTLEVQANLLGIVDGITSQLDSERGSTHITVTSGSLAKPYNVTGRYLVWAPTIQVEVLSWGDPPMGYDGSGLVSVSLYLRS